MTKTTFSLRVLLIIVTLLSHVASPLSSQNCPGLGSITLHVVKITPPVLTAPAFLCPNGSGMIMANSGYASYHWSSGANTQNLHISNPGTYTVTVTNDQGCEAIVSKLVPSFPVSQVSITSVPDACHGQVMLNASPGFVSYHWNNGINAMNISVDSAGTYQLVAVDTNGCSITTAFSVIIPALPEVKISGDSVLCKNDTIQLVAVSQLPVFSWSNGTNTAINSVSAVGTYTVIASDSLGCLLVDSIKIIAAPDILLNISGNSAICSGDSTELSVPGGYSLYLWSTNDTTNSVSVYAAGGYTVTIVDVNGCKHSDSVDLVVSPSPQPIISQGNYNCDGMILLSTDSTYAHILWSNGSNLPAIELNSPGQYDLMVTDSLGCTGATNVTITIPPLPVVAITGIDSICAGQNYVLDATPGFDLYLWNNGSGSPEITINQSGDYFVDVTDQNGCKASDTIHIDLITPPVPAISGPAIICSTGTAVFSVQNNFAHFLWSTGDTTSTIFTSTPGTYTITVTTAQGCTATAARTLAIGNELMPSISTLPYQCDHQRSFEVEGSYATYLWSNGIQTEVNTAINEGVYTVTVTDSFGCSGTASLTVTIPTTPPVVFQGPGSLCASDSALLSLNNSYAQYEWSDGSNLASLQVNQGGQYAITVTDNYGCTSEGTFAVAEWPPIQLDVHHLPYQCDGKLELEATSGFQTYEWTEPTGMTGNSALITANMNGEYTVLVTDFHGCTAMETTQVQIPVQEAVSISGGAHFCAGGSLELTASGNFLTYQWNNGANTSAIVVDTQGVYIVTATDTLGCTTTASIQVAIEPAPLPAIIGPTASCPGVDAMLSLTDVYPGVLWSNGATTNQISVQPPFNASVTVTDFNGCQGTASAILNFSPVPTPVIQTLPYACNGELTLDAGTAVDYQWTGPNGFGSTLQQNSVTMSGHYEVTVHNTAGCTGTASLDVTIPDPAQLTITGVSQICPLETSTLKATTGFASYQWSNGQNMPEITVNLPNDYTVTATDGFGCTYTSSFVLSESPPLSTEILGDTMVCSGQSTTWTLDNAFDAYSWSNGSIGNAVTIQAAGLYTVTVTNANGCSGVAQAMLKVNASPLAVITQIPYHCDHQISMDAGDNWSHYQWSNGQTTELINTSQSGSYTVTVTNGFGCTGVSFLQVTIPSDPFVEVTGGDVICFGDTLTLYANSNTSSLQWSDGTAGNSLDVWQSGSYSVVVTDTLGCTATAGMHVNLLPAIITTIENISCRLEDVGMNSLHFTASSGCDSLVNIITLYEPNPDLALDNIDPVVASYNDLVTIHIHGNFDISKVELQSATFNLSCLDCLDPSFIPLDTGFISVTAYNNDGCQTKQQITVLVDEPLFIYVPNVIKPASSDNNIFYVLSGSKLDKVYNLNIFDRWGNELFHRAEMPTNSPSDGWNGEFRGQIMQPGVYVYYFEIREGTAVKRVKSGDFTIIR